MLFLWVFRSTEEAPNEEGIKLKHEKNRQSAIVSAKRKKKYYDKFGTEINDPDLIKDIQQGANVVYYHEEKLK